MKHKGKRYRDHSRRTLFVTDGILRGDRWFTGYHNKAGAIRRLVVGVLPIREDREQAQEDLDEYAKIKGFKEAD